jgi:hypothetical protein
MSWKFTDKLQNVISIVNQDGSIDSMSINSTEAIKLMVSGVLIEPYTQTQDEMKRQIKYIRSSSLEKFTKNSGVSAVYSVNYEAAIKGAGDNTYILPSGETPNQRLTTLGQYVGMTAAQFAAYIIAENRGDYPSSAAGKKMANIEQEYMRIYYSLPLITDVIVDTFKAFCDNQVGSI